MSLATRRVYICHFDGVFSASYSAALGGGGIVCFMCLVSYSQVKKKFWCMVDIVLQVMLYTFIYICIIS